jgi:hypothetical protein
MEENPAITVVAHEVIETYKEYEAQKSKIKRSEVGKRLDKAIKKLKKHLDRDESRNYI